MFSPTLCILIRKLARSGECSLVAQMVKSLPAIQETWVQSLDWGDLGERNGPSPVYLPGAFHGQRSLAGYSLQGHKDLNRTELLSTHAHKLRSEV